MAPNTLLEPATPINNTLSLEGTETDTETIVSTVQIVNQKSGASNDALPNQPPPPTTVTAVDGELSAAADTIQNPTRRSLDLSGRSIDDYEVVFEGTGTGLNDRDGSIEGTAYLTYTVVSNLTYDVSDCLSFCDRVEGCGKSISCLLDCDILTLPP